MASGFRARWGAVSAAALLAGCGGGVSGTPTPPIASTPAPTPTPVATPTPTPTPTPTATSTDYDTTEYRNTAGAVSMNALAAYQHGATGAGVRVGVIDSGINLTSSDFAGRIDPASGYAAGNGTAQDPDGHGTAVAFTLAGGRNGTGTQGVAFDATLVVERADTPGSCGTTAGCTFDDADIAKGLDRAVTAGARMVNLSLGGDPPSAEMVAAIDRATAAGVVLVISAGNDGASNPDAFAEVANNAAVARGLVVVAGSVDAHDAISSFSNHAGDAAGHYLTAVGEGVRAPDQTGTAFIWSGTSFSAPQISGALALLAQAFPSLSAQQLVAVLFASARDAGASGVDAVYGGGVLDLTRAFQPLGTSRVAGTTAAVSLADNATLSAPMGDARSGGMGVVILDGFRRPFALDLAATLHRAALPGTLATALTGHVQSFTAGAGTTALALTVAPRGTADRLTPATGDAPQAKAIAGSVTSRLARGTAIAFGFSQGAAGLGASLAGRAEPAFLIARDPAREAGFVTVPASAAALRQQVGGVGLTVWAESGAVLTADAQALAGLAGRYTRHPYQRVALGLDRRVGPLAAALTATRLDERDTLLGAHFAPALGGARGASWFVDASARLASGGWTLGGTVRRGRTRALGSLGAVGAVTTEGWAADLGRDGVLGGDSLGLRLAQPLRVSSGGLGLTLPVGWTDAGVSGWTDERLNLAPTGRELDVEARYARRLGPGLVDANLFWRRQPGNIAAAAPDLGAALRWRFGF